MATEPKPARPTKKKRQRKLREEFVDYIVEIESWDWAYSFSLNTERRPIDPYDEFRHLQIRGRLLRPAGLKTDQVVVSLLPTLDLEKGRRKDLKPLALGALGLRRDGIDGNITANLDQADAMPEDVGELPENDADYEAAIVRSLSK